MHDNNTNVNDDDLDWTKHYNNTIAYDEDLEWTIHHNYTIAQDDDLGWTKHLASAHDNDLEWMIHYNNSSNHNLELRYIQIKFIYTTLLICYFHCIITSIQSYIIHTIQNIKI